MCIYCTESCGHSKRDALKRSGWILHEQLRLVENLFDFMDPISNILWLIQHIVAYMECGLHRM